MNSPDVAQRQINVETTYPTLRRHDDVVTTSLSISQRRRRYAPNETPNNVTMESRQDVSVVHLHDVLLVHLYNISCKSQIKHPITLFWYVSTTSLSYLFATSCQQVSNTHSNDFVITSIWQVSTSHLSIKSKFF